MDSESVYFSSTTTSKVVMNKSISRSRLSSIVPSEERMKLGSKKIGKLVITKQGEFIYKSIKSKQILGSIQLGIQHSIGNLVSKPGKTLLIQDFLSCETTNFLPCGSEYTPRHKFQHFSFKVLSPIAFRLLREVFEVKSEDYLVSMCGFPLKELSNPGASGSLFYLSRDDALICKTVSKQESDFLYELLPGYYLNLNQNLRTLLPKFFGLYCYRCQSTDIRIVVMNNLLPSNFIMHQKYDLKGSTYGRKASKRERSKTSPTYKDLDFLSHHPDGIIVDRQIHKAILRIVQLDCKVLQSFNIMDYSLLLAIHNIDEDRRRSQDPRVFGGRKASSKSTYSANIRIPLNVQGGIPARNVNGDRLLLFIGIIDILQNYEWKKKLEHTYKATIHNGKAVSVNEPKFYAKRFETFLGRKVFRCSDPHSPGYLVY